MIHRIEIATRRGLRDARGEHAAAQIRDYLELPVAAVRTRDVYLVEAELSGDELARVVRELTDPVLQSGAVDRVEDGPFDVAIAVGLKPGVADPVGKSARVAIADTLGRPLGEDTAVYTSELYLLDGVDEQAAERIAAELLANPVIHTIRVSGWGEWNDSEPDHEVPKVRVKRRPAVATMDLEGDDEELARISREGMLALSTAEMRAIRDHFRAAAADPRRRRLGLAGAPTDVELECLAQTWSEHCKHKIFNAAIRYRDEQGRVEVIDSLFSTYIRGVTERIRRRHERDGDRSWLVSVFHDNAGVVEFDERIHLVYKVETHNSPSALDPYGGAITGIVGVNRDPFGTGRGADLLVNVWGYCFAPPDYEGELPPRLLHPRRVRDGVHRGVIDGGNQSGIPYGRGWELFDERYLGKPLVFCGTVGALPVKIAGTPGEEKAASPGDAIVMVGGRIGADGIHGATFSSAALDESSPAQAVQIGDPITQKMMFDFLLEARDRGLYSAITDNGAGGLSSSVGEMAEGPGGARIDLARAPLKYAGLAPWEVFLSEAQERMTLAVPPENLDELLALAARREVEATPLGEFTADGALHVTWGDETVALLEMAFLHDGAPPLELVANWQPPRFEEPPRRADDAGEVLLALVARHNLVSNESIARHYDHEVKGLAVVRPFIGVDADVPAEATVSLARHGSRRGLVLSEGVNPYLSDIDTFAMAAGAVDEAVRRQLAAGARLDRIAALDNFCWPDPVQSPDTPDGEYKLAQLVRACQGLAAACLAYGVPLISGKDSMKNESTLGGRKIPVPPTLLVSALGQIDDVGDVLTLEWRSPGDLVYALGETGEHTGASEYYRWLGERDGRRAELGEPQPWVGRKAPVVEPDKTLPLYRALAAATAAGVVRSAATPARGGLGVSLVRQALAGGLGAELDLDALPGAASLADDVALFSESNGRFVVTVAAADADRFEAHFADLPCARLGQVTAAPRLRLRRGERPLADLELAELRAAAGGGPPSLPLDPPAGSADPPAPATGRDAPAVGGTPVPVLVVSGLGLNCEVETAEAFRLSGGAPRRVPLQELLAGRERFADHRILAFPGGFAFGDHLGAGCVFANKIRWRLYDQLVEFIAGGGLVIGICNGFQTMTRLGLVPGFDGDYRTPLATLAPNRRLGYWDTWVRLAVDPESPCVWTRGIESLELPSRHGEGRFLTASEEIGERLARARQIPLRYVDGAGRPTEAWPANPNGSPGGVAGVCDPTGRIFGLMPHPDAFLYDFQHPYWRRRGAQPGAGAGLAIFRNGVLAAG